jgi:hypothetical protein
MSSKLDMLAGDSVMVIAKVASPLRAALDGRGSSFKHWLGP